LAHMVPAACSRPPLAAHLGPVCDLDFDDHVPINTAMNEIPLGFCRELKLQIKGRSLKGNLSIESLNFNEAKQKWECRWSLDHLYPSTVGFTGDDPLAALTRTLEFVSDFIRDSNADGFKIYWQSEGDNAGLPFT